MKLSKKYKKFYMREMRKYNNLKKFLNHHHQQQQLKAQSGDLNNSSKNYNLPVLTQVELISPTDVSSPTVVFTDYLLVSSKSKCKQLLHNLFDQVKLDDKNSFKVVDGFLKVKNWQPIRLSSINSSMQSSGARDNTVEENLRESSSISQSFSNCAAAEPGHSESAAAADGKVLTNGDLNNNERGDSARNSRKLKIGNSNQTARNSSSSCSETSSSSSSSSSSSEGFMSTSSKQPQQQNKKINNNNNNNNSRSPSVSSSSSSDMSLMSDLSVSSGSSSSTSKINNSNMDMGGKKQQQGKKPSSRLDHQYHHPHNSPTVYDILSHVISFSSIIIKIRPKAENELLGGSSNYPINPSQNNVDELLKQQLQLSLAQPFIKTEEQTSNYHNENATSNNKSTKQHTVPVKQSTAINSKSQQSVDDESPLSNSRQQSSNEQQQQLIQNQLTSNLYANSQLANLLPLFNIPIIGQFLNGLKQQQQQQQQQQMQETETNSSSDQNLDKESLNKSLPKKLHSLINAPAKQQHQASASVIASNATAAAIKNQASPSPSLSSTSSSSSSSLNSNAKNQPHVPNNNTNKSSSSSSSSAEAMTTTANLLKQLPPTNMLLANHNHHHNAAAAKFSLTSQSSHNSSSRKQRERTTFDPHEEITRLMQIFERTHHPTRYQIANICDFLNALACRKDKKPLEPYNIQYWFKNARAALRRKSKGELSGGVSAAVTTTTPGTSADDLINSQISFNSTNVAGNESDNEIIEQILRMRPASAKSASYGLGGGGYSLGGGGGGQVKREDGEEDELDFARYSDDFDEDEEDEDLSEDENELNNAQNHEDDDHEANGLGHIYQPALGRVGHKEGEFGDNHSYSDNHRKSATKEYGDDDVSNGNGMLDSNDNEIDNYDYQDDNGDDYDDEEDMNGTTSSHNENLGKAGGDGGGMQGHGGSKSANRRNRVFIDPISEVPILEHYFSIETYPDHYLIEKICDILNNGEYRFKFPKLESRNIQLWFKNHRAKLKRVKPAGGGGAVAGCIKNE